MVEVPPEQQRQGTFETVVIIGGLTGDLKSMVMAMIMAIMIEMTAIWSMVMAVMKAVLWSLGIHVPEDSLQILL